MGFPSRKVPLEDGSEVLLPVPLFIVVTHSRFVAARMITTRKTYCWGRGS